MPKRALDLTSDSSDSSDSSYEPTSRRTRARSSSRPPEASSTAARFAAASPFLAPRSKLLGGTGTGLEDKPKLKAEVEVEGGSSKGKGKGKAKVKDRDVPLDTDSPASPSKKKRKKRNPLGVSASPDGVLSFPFQAKGGEASQDEQRRSLEFAEGKVLVTTYVKEKRGRPRTKPKLKGKGKGRKKRQDSSSESSESSSDDDSDDEAICVDLDTIIGADPDKQVLRALVVSPRMQVPWTPHRFASTRENKPRGKKGKGKGKAVKNDEQEEEEDKKEQKPTFTRHYADKIPLLLLHDEADTSDWQEWTNVVTHRPQSDVGEGKKGGMEANLVVMVRRNPPSQRHSLRIAIHTSKMDANTWKKTENSLWVQDFPQLASAPPASPALNPTHTPFSSGLLEFLLSDATGLPKTASYKPYTDLFRLFDFSSSKDVRLVTSLAGSYEGSDAVEQGGGLTSLARAIEGLQPRDKGKWKVEYLTHTTEKISLSVVEQLFAAFCGIPPTEHSLSSSSRSKALATSFAASKSDKLVVLFPSESNVEAAGKEGKIGREELRWEGEEWDELRKKDARGEVCRDVELKSGRVGHHTVALVIHQPLEKDKTDDDEEQYEAFLYVGSHTPTPSAWGLYTLPTGLNPSLTPSLTLPQTHLGLLLRLCTAGTWSSLKSQIDELVPWKRPVRKYGAGRDGGPARNVERKERRKAGRPRKKRVGEEEEEDE
ncbi:hypothetical protein NBRC10513v2_002638 [Rhodotorula toruloides]